MEKCFLHTDNLAKCGTGLSTPRKPMSRHRFAKSGLFRAVRNNWRPFVLGVLIVLVLAITCTLYMHGSDRAERAATAIGGTLIGMLCIAFWVCRR